MAVESMPISLLLQEERDQHTRLLQLSLREQRLIEQFTEALRQVAADRREVLACLSSIRCAIHDKKKLIALLHCPPELQQWQALHAPLVDADEVELLMPSRSGAEVDHAADTFRLSSRASLPVSSLERSSVEAAACAGVPRLEKVVVPPVLLEKAFVPFVHPTSREFMKRPCTGDISVLKSSAPHMGRVLVSLCPVKAGQLVFAESPWMNIPADDDVFPSLLPPNLQHVWENIQDQKRVFDAQPHWDRRLVAPFLAFIAVLLEGRYSHPTNRDAAMLPQLIMALSNPLKDMEADRIDELCSFAHFLKAALPENLDGLITEDALCRFLSTFQTNAAMFHSSAAHTYLLDTHSSASPATSVYASGPLVRCLFGLISLVEHSCHPNATLVWHRTNSLADEDSMVVELRALRKIEPGDRLSIAYVPTVLPREERQSLLWRRYWFHCRCTRCTDAPDLLRAVMVREQNGASGVLMAPVGDGTFWAAVGSNDREPFHGDKPRAAIILEGDLRKQFDESPMVLLENALCAFNDGTDGAMRLSPFHYLSLRSFIVQCGKATAALGDELEALLNVLISYGDAVTKRVFVDHSSPASMVLLLQSMQVDPVATWFQEVRDAASTRRQRLIAVSEVLHKMPDVAKLAEEVLSIQTEVAGDAMTCVSFCVAVWELLFGVAHSAMSRRALPAPRLEQVSNLRRGAALGLWLMQSFALCNHESTRAMQWQAVLLESDAAAA